MKRARRDAAVRGLEAAREALRLAWMEEENDASGGALDRLACKVEELIEEVYDHNKIMARWRRKG